MKVPSIVTEPRNMFDTIDMRSGYHEKLLPQAYKLGLNEAQTKGEVTNEEN